MKTIGVDWMATLIVLLAALLLFAIGLVAPDDSSVPQVDADRPVAGTTALDIELARCKRLGLGADGDAGCLKAWRLVSRRLVEYGELHHGVAVNRSADRSGREEGAAGGCCEKDQSPQSRSIPEADSVRASAGLKEQSQ